MTTFTKISAAALFAIFLTACDKPAEKTTTEPAKPATTQTVETAKKEVPAASTTTVDEQAREDFKKLVAWNKAQEQNLAQAQNDLQQSIATQDKAKIEEALSAFKSNVDDVLKSLDELDISTDEFKAFKAQTKESLSLSNEVIADSVKAMTAPTPELQSALQAKAEKLVSLGNKLQQKQIELEKKYAQ